MFKYSVSTKQKLLSRIDTSNIQRKLGFRKKRIHINTLGTKTEKFRSIQMCRKTNIKECDVDKHDKYFAVLF